MGPWLAEQIKLGPVQSAMWDNLEGDAPDFVEVGEAGIAVDDATRRQRRVQLVG